MNKWMVWIGVIAVLNMPIALVQAGGEDELTLLKEQIEKMERQHQREMGALKERIRTLETKSSSTPLVKMEGSETASIHNRLDTLEKGMPWGKDLPSMRDLTFQLGGELEYEYVDTENDEAVSGSAPSNPGGHFSLDKLVLTPKVYFRDNLFLKADLEMTSDAFKLDEIYVQLNQLPTGPYLSYVKVGLEDVFNSPNAGWHRHTEDYPLLGTAFWQDEERMVEIGGDIASTPLYWRFSVGNGRRVRTRSNNDASSGYPILHDDDDNPDGNFNKEFKAGVGIKHATDHWGSIDILGWGADAELSGADIGVLQGITGYTGGPKHDENTEIGIMAKYNLGGFEVQSQFIRGKDGVLERRGWYVQPLYKIPVGAKYLNSVTAFFRYGELDIKDIPEVFSDPLTWDREKITVALIADIIKNVKFKFEYKLNDEKTGAGTVDNDEFVAQLEMKF